MPMKAYPSRLRSWERTDATVSLLLFQSQILHNGDIELIKIVALPHDHLHAVHYTSGQFRKITIVVIMIDILTRLRGGESNVVAAVRRGAVRANKNEELARLFDKGVKNTLHARSRHFPRVRI